MKTLVLWDIDGTLIQSGGAGERALIAALRDEFGIVGTLENVEIAGRTDAWIARRMLTKFAVPDTSENIAHYLAGYLRALPGELHNPEARTLPGVQELLTTLHHRSDIAQGLLTGNLRRGAEIKLTHHKLWAYFNFGAFADDSEMRNDLGPHAVRRAGEYHSVEFLADRVFVVGDTPHDIACGKAIGARTIGVATGRFSVDQLRACEPSAVLQDLSDTTSFLRLLEERILRTW